MCRAPGLQAVRVQRFQGALRFRLSGNEGV